MGKKKTASRKTAAKKTASRKPVGKKPAPRKAAGKKAASSRTAGKSTASRKPAVKKKVKKVAKAKRGAKVKVKKTSTAPAKRSSGTARAVQSARLKKRPSTATAGPSRARSAPGSGRLAFGGDTSLPSEPLTTEQLRKVKTGLTKRDLARFRALLLDKRAEILGDVESMEIDARTKNAGGNLSNMPVHMADVGSDNYEQEFTLGLVESERRLLMEIDDALDRFQKGIYGVCVERGVPISRPRLEAKPWAKYCIEVARERERRGLH